MNFELQSCCSTVDDGPSMVRGIRRTRRCESKVVFEKDGRFYCTVHGKSVGYVVPKEERHTYVVHYVTAQGKVEYCFFYDCKSERGARMAFARADWLKGATITRIVLKPKGTTTDENGEVIPVNPA